MLTNGNDKAGKCPAVARVEVGGGGRGVVRLGAAAID